MPLTSTAATTTRLPAGIAGTVITPDHPDYDQARTVTYGDMFKRPGLIVRVSGPDDIATAIAYARDNGLELAVRSGGHSGAGFSSTEGGLVIDVRDLKGIDIDPDNKTVWASAGVTAVELTEALTPHKLIVGFGDAGTVGVSGITLGGGVGYLSRKHGLTIDSLLAAEIVTANGKVLIADADNHPDLFWALRGGGGNFGVVTRLKYQLHALPAFTGGMLLLPATAETIAGFVKAAREAPDELSSIANVMPAPPMPFLPAEAHGKTVIMAMLAFAGDDAAAEAALAPFRAIGKPLADFVRPGPFASMYPPDDGEEYHPTAVSMNQLVNTIGIDEAETILGYLAESDAPLRVCQIRVLGGAVARVPADATAYAHRQSPIMVNYAAFYTGPDDRPAKLSWLKDFAAAMYQGDDGAYVNFVNDEGPERVRAAYPGATWDRLRRVKRQYDPENLFRLNQNIPPA
ncbi:FAD-binding oxidoreductase [Devosia sp. CN2-171]|uniref:FAD-binding oxidoreductase n=1 Tax=Devosia sp. CN2-171 TaxID=3400909 RepID=UPI003BF80D03